MARDVKIDILAADKTGKAVVGAAKGFEGLANRVKAFGDEMIRSGQKTRSGLLGALTSVAATAVGVGAKIGGNLVSSIGSAVSGMGPYLQIALLVAGTIAALFAGPLIGAALAAGILLGVGAGVIGIGALIASKNPEVQAAAGKLGNTIKTVLTAATQSFVTPMAKSIERIRGFFLQIQPQLTSMFATVAPLIEPVTAAILLMVQRALPGFQQALGASVPLFNVLIAGLPKIGTALSTAFSKIASAGPGAELFLKDLIGFIADLIVSIGTVIGWLGKLYIRVNTAGEAIWKAMTTASTRASAALTFLRAAGSAAINGLSSRVRSAASAVRSALATLSAAARGGVGPFAAMASGIAAAFNRAVSAARAAANAVRSAVNAIKSAANAAKGATSGIGGIVGRLFTGQPGSFMPAYAGGPSFAASGRGSTEAPREISVNSTLSIDGPGLERYFRYVVRSEIDEAGRRAKVGRR